MQFHESAELIRERNIWIDAVQVKQLDALQAEQTKAPSAWALRYWGFPLRSTSGAGPCQARFRRDDQVVRKNGCSASRIRRSLTLGPYESAVSINVTPKSTARRSTRIASPGLSAHPTQPRELHRAVSQTHHRQVAGDGKLPTCASGLVVRICSRCAPYRDPFFGAEEAGSRHQPGLHLSEHLLAMSVTRPP